MQRIYHEEHPHRADGHRRRPWEGANPDLQSLGLLMAADSDLQRGTLLQGWELPGAVTSES